MKTRLAATCFAIFVVLVAAWQIRAATNTLSFVPGGSGTYLISLPGSVGTPALAKAEDLFTEIGPHAGLTVAKFDPVNDLYFEWDGASCANGPEPGALSTCGSMCFCIAPSKGVGFRVTVGAAASLTITGNDAPTMIDLQGPGPTLSGTHDISIPYATPLATASDIMDEIDAQGGSTVSVSRLDNVSGLLQTYAGTSNVTNFPVVSGEGYKVTVLSSSTYIPSATQPVVTGVAGTYTINGDVTSSDFAWQLVGPNCGNPTTTLTGTTAEHIAADFEASINALCGTVACTGTCGASRVSNVLTVSASTGHTLRVGTGVASCPVTAAGCSFNPTIELLPEDPLLVVLESFTADASPDGVRVSWRTSTEVDTAGFRVLRGTMSRPNKSERIVVISEFIPASGTELIGADYEFVDRSVTRTTQPVNYYLEDVDLFGRATRHGPVQLDFWADRKGETKPGR